MPTLRGIIYASAPAVVITVGLPPSQARACHPTRLCMQLPVQLDDAEDGTLPYDDYLPARGVRVTIFRPPPEPPLGVYLDEDGCVEFDTQYNAGLKLLWYPEAVLGAANGNNVRVKAFESLQDQVDDAIYPEGVDVPAIPDDAMVQLDVPPADLEDPLDTIRRNQLTNALAVAVNVIHRLNTLPGTHLVDEHELELVLVPNNNARQSGLYTIQLGPDSRHERFVLAHEIGHWIQRQSSFIVDPVEGLDWSNNYDYVPAVTRGACDFVVQYPDDTPTPNEVSDSHYHGIRSAEHNSAAMTEGFAHFTAAVAFNDIAEEEGVFRYYKDIDTSMESGVEAYQDFVDAGGLVSLQGGTDPGTLGGHSAWVATEEDCEDDWAQTDEISSGMDWMRFWWQFLTDQQGDQPGYWDIVHLLVFADTHEVSGVNVYQWQAIGEVWTRLFDAIGDPASGLTSFEARFEDMTPDHGVYNGP